MLERRLVPIGTLVVAALAILPSCGRAGSPAASGPSPFDLPRPQGPVGYANPFIGTGSGGKVVGRIETFPGADVPFGMVQWSPDTPDPEQPPSLAGGYLYSVPRIDGFSLTHLSGAGCMTYGDVPFMPITKTLTASPASDPQRYYSSFSHANERAWPGYYSVKLASGVKVAITATTRTGVADFSFPPGSKPGLLVDVSGSQNGVTGSSFEMAGPRLMTGYATSGNFCSSGDTYTVHFAAELNTTPAGIDVWNGSTISAGRSVSGAGEGLRSTSSWDSSAGSGDGGYLRFARSTSPLNLLVKVGISFTSTADALANLRAEQPGWNFSGVAGAAAGTWSRFLGRISVSGGTHSQMVTFYTDLYHCLLFPSVFSDANGSYMGFDGRVHVASTLPQYSNFSGWDIYRAEMPLLAIIAPRETAAMMQSLVRDGEQGGWLPRWPVANGYTGMMGGDPSDAMIASAYALGVRGFDAATALSEMVKGATVLPPAAGVGPVAYKERPGLSSYMEHGYVVGTPEITHETGSTEPDGASLTLEYAVDDFAISQLAQALGNSPTAAEFLRRSGNWSVLYDPATGWMAPRQAGGSFPPGWPKGSLAVARALQELNGGGTGQVGFQEGDTWQYSWAVPQDLAGLFAKMGGDAAVVARLQAFFTQLNAGPIAPYDWAGNETCMEIPWEADYAGAPWLTQEVVRRISTTLYGPTPGGEPGNDDLGAMSAWNVWAMLGMYPEVPGTATLVLASPAFPSEQVHLAGGRSITINAQGAASGTEYVHGLTVNGQTSNEPFLPAQAAMVGATLDFNLGSTPDKAWGTAPQDAPPSYPPG